MEYEVFVRLKVVADSEQNAYYACQSAVENLVGGDITEAEVDHISEKETQ